MYASEGYWKLRILHFCSEESEEVLYPVINQTFSYSYGASLSYKQILIMFCLAQNIPESLTDSEVTV